MSLLEVTNERIEQFLSKNKRKLAYMESYFSVDDNRDKKEDFTEDKLKVLCVFLTPASSRAVSNTFNALMTCCKKADMENVVVDSCYYPEDANMELLEKEGIPYIFGSTCHQPASFYDLILMSNAVCPEVLNIPKFLYHSGLGLTIEERDKQDVPLIIMGGAAANETSIVLGPINRDGKCIGKSMVDMANYGYGEQMMTEIAGAFLRFKKEGINLHSRKEVRERLIDEKVAHDYLFFPEYYEWVYDDDKFTIKEIKKLDDRLPDRVNYNRIHSEDFGWDYKTFNLSGDNADSHDLQISTGCSGSSSCCAFSFAEGTLLNTNKGLIQIENLLKLGTPTGSPQDNVVRYELDGVEIQAQSGVERAPLIYSVGTKPCSVITTKRGYKLSVTSDHKCIVNRDGEDITVLTSEVKPGDRVYLSKSQVFGNHHRTLPECEFIGRMVGDGYYNDRMALMGSKSEESDLESLLSEAGISWTSKRDKARNTVEFHIPEEYRRFGFEKYDQSGKHIPNEVMCYSEEQIKAFLKGLLDADATISKNGKDITFATSSKEIHDTVKQLMLSVGILTTTRENDNVRFDEELGFDSTTHLYKLYVWGNDSKKVIKSLNLRNSEKRKRLENAKYSDTDTTHKMSLGDANPYMTEYVKLPTDEVVSIEPDGIRNIYDITVEPTHTVVANGMVMNQCMESTVAGHYTEKRLETVIEQMKEVRRHCAPNTLSYFSFNLNYYYRFMDLLAESSKYFSGVTLLNERVDIIANSPEQMQLAKKLGLKRVSMAIEGMGERVRDGILNKNLPHETLMKGIRVVSKLGVMMVKFGIIITGQETEEDFQEWIKELEEMNKIRDEEGSNHAWQINHTPMVFYSQIAMRHLPRITSENCYNNVKTMGTMVEAYKRLGYRAKYNGKGCGTWLEQLLLDFGPAGTDWMVGLVLDQGLGYIRFFGDKMKQAATEELKKRGYEDPLFFTFARPQDWVFPNDHINYASDELKKMWWDRTVAMNFDTKLCLRTAANLDNVKCYGCKACSSPEEIKGMVKREMCDEHTFEEVAEMLSDSRNQKTVRVVVKMDPKWFFYNRTSLAHYITSRFLQKSDVICDNFYSVGKTTTTWLSSNGQKGWFGGNWCFDINLRGPVSVNEFTEVIEEINSELESCKILRVIDDTKTQLVKRETNITFLGQTTEHSMSRIKDRLSNFEWDIKVPIKSMGGQLDTEIKHMPELKEKVLFAQAGNRIMIGMDLPAHISPYMVMSSILGKPYEKMLEDFAFDVVDQYSEVDMVDEKGHHLGYSYFDACYTKEAPIEKIRKYLYKLTKR